MLHGDKSLDNELVLNYPPQDCNEILKRNKVDLKLRQIFDLRLLLHLRSLKRVVCLTGYEESLVEHFVTKRP